MMHHRWVDVPSEQITDTIARRFITGDSVTIGRFELKQGGVVPSHSHPNEQTDWTHLRIFRLNDAAAEQALGAGRDAATLRVVPDEATRKANSDRSAGLRDRVRREVWTALE